MSCWFHWCLFVHKDCNYNLLSQSGACGIGLQPPGRIKGWVGIQNALNMVDNDPALLWGKSWQCHHNIPVNIVIMVIHSLHCSVCLYGSKNWRPLILLPPNPRLFSLLIPESMSMDINKLAVARRKKSYHLLIYWADWMPG